MENFLMKELQTLHADNWDIPMLSLSVQMHGEL